MYDMNTLITNDAFWAFCGVLTGSVFRDLVMRLLQKPDRDRNDERALRDELRKDNEALRAEVHELKIEVIRWRNSFYAAINAILTDDKATLRELIRSGLHDEYTTQTSMTQ